MSQFYTYFESIVLADSS